jgi:hypothetical protein
MTIRTGQCLCGQARLATEGEPIRIGICHCTDCRKESGSAFTYYAIWPADLVRLTGRTTEHRGQHFCPHCGARLLGRDGDETEVKAGILSDAPTGLVPGYELWVKRRESWLRPIPGAEQFQSRKTARPAADRPMRAPLRPTAHQFWHSMTN